MGVVQEVFSRHLLEKLHRDLEVFYGHASIHEKNPYVPRQEKNCEEAEPPESFRLGDETLEINPSSFQRDPTSLKVRQTSPRAIELCVDDRLRTS